VAAFVHTAFARASSSAATPADEHYIGPVLAAIAAQAGDDALTCVGVGPRRNFRARRWWDPLVRAGGPIVTPIERLAPRRTLAGALDLWRRRDDLARQITTAPGLREAAILERYDLWPVLGEQLALAARVQWPWSARAMDEAAAALDALAPDVVVTYAEAGGWGRALVLEARRRAIPSAGLQHGFIYRHWLNYRHEPDEMEARADDGGFPRPDRTLLFDGYAAAFLEGAGHFPPGSLAVTGSARLDALSTHVRALSADRDALRRALGVRAEEKLLVLAAKFSEIEREIPALFTAVAARPGTRLIVKPHPAETPALYAPLAAGTGAVTVADAAADLGRLLAAADAIVTMNSTVAIDGLVLGIPALVLGAATNLAPFVEAGVMLGATGDAVRPSLETLLYDLEARARLTERAAAFAAAHEMRADGGAAGRSAADILVLAAR
jgi:hypothetical protein